MNMQTLIDSVRFQPISTFTPVSVVCTGSKELRRYLTVNRNKYGAITVSVTLQPPRARPGRRIASSYFKSFAWSSLSAEEAVRDIRIRFYRDDTTMWVGSTLYELLPAEADQLIAAFGFAHEKHPETVICSAS